MPAHSHTRERLVVWQRSIELVVESYEIARRFPPDGRKCLVLGFEPDSQSLH